MNFSHGAPWESWVWVFKMRSKLFAILVSGYFVLPVATLANSANIAVVAFQQLDNSPGLRYLKDALPDSLTPVIADHPAYTAIERRRVAEILKEIEWEQSGLIAERQRDSTRKLLNADYLILGSFSGTPESVTVNLNLVNVITGEIESARRVDAPLAELFDRVSSEFSSMLPSQSGNKSSYVVLFSNPENASVTMNGVSIGKTPIQKKAVNPGSHTFVFIKPGFEEESITVELDPGETEEIRGNLVPRRSNLRGFAGLAFLHIVPLENVVRNAQTAQFHIGAGYRIYNFRAEISWHRMSHSYSLASPFNANVEQTRKYSVFNYGLLAEIHPFKSFTSVAPWFGFGMGGLQYTDYRARLINGEQDEEELDSGLKFKLMASAGLEFLPGRSISPYAEIRYEFVPGKINRTVHSSQGIIGGLVATQTQIEMHSWQIAAGIRSYF